MNNFKKVLFTVLVSLLMLPFSALAFSGVNYDNSTGIFSAGNDMSAFMMLNPLTQTNMFKANTFNFLDTNSHSLLNLLDNSGNAHVQLGAFDVGNGTSLDIQDSTQIFKIFAGNNFNVEDPMTGTQWLTVDTANQSVTIGGALVLKNQYEPLTATATSVVISPSTAVLSLNPSMPLGSLSIVFPNSPADGQDIKINTTLPIASVTLSGGTFVGILPTINALNSLEYIYSSGDSSWHYQK